jgi:hypothetical protein
LSVFFFLVVIFTWTMATNHGRLKREIVGGSLMIGTQVVVDRDQNGHFNELRSGSSLGVGGDATIEGNLLVGGCIDASCLNVTGNLVVDGTTINGGIVTPLTLVSKNGDDASGERNNMNKPFLTIAAAVAASVAGDLIEVYPGVYDEYDVLNGFPTPVNLRLHFHAGAIVQPSGTSVGGGNPGVAPIFHLDREGKVEITGHGQFVNIGNGENDTCAFTACVDGNAIIVAECDRVSSVQAWGVGGNTDKDYVPSVSVSKAIIDWVATAYGGALVNLDHCTLVNTGPVGIDYNARKTTIRARNCTFYRDRENTEYFSQSTGASNNVQKSELAAPTSLFHIHPKQKAGTSTSDEFSCEFYDCQFINRVVGTSPDDAGHGIWCNNFDNTTGSQLVLDNCRFDVTGPDSAPIYYTRFVGVATSNPNPTQSTAIPETKSFLSSCISNADILYDGTATNTNEFEGNGIVVSSLFKMDDRFARNLNL